MGEKEKYWTFKILHVIRKNLTLPVHFYFDLIQWNLQEELGDSFKWIYLDYCEYKESEAQLRSKFFLAMWFRFNSLRNLPPTFLHVTDSSINGFYVTGVLARMTVKSNLSSCVNNACWSNHCRRCWKEENWIGQCLNHAFYLWNCKWKWELTCILLFIHLQLCMCVCTHVPGYWFRILFSRCS